MLIKRLSDEQLTRLELFKRMTAEFDHGLDGSDFVVIMDYVITGVLNPEALNWEWTPGAIIKSNKRGAA